MHRKFVLFLAAATLSVPVGATVAASPAFAVTHTRYATVDNQHNDSRDASRDISKADSKRDNIQDSSNDISTDTLKGTSKERSSLDVSKAVSSVDNSPNADRLDS
jgi:hypothetical protein